jgi:hypothetical protein
MSYFAPFPLKLCNLFLGTKISEITIVSRVGSACRTLGGGSGDQCVRFDGVGLFTGLCAVLRHVRGTGAESHTEDGISGLVASAANAEPLAPEAMRSLDQRRSGRRCWSRRKTRPPTPIRSRRKIIPIFDGCAFFNHSLAELQPSCAQRVSKLSLKGLADPALHGQGRRAFAGAVFFIRIAERALWGW